MPFEAHRLPQHVGHAKYPVTGSVHPDPYYPMRQFQLVSCSSQRTCHPRRPFDKPICKVMAPLCRQVYPSWTSLPLSIFSQAAKLSPASLVIKSLSAFSSSSASDGAVIVTRFRSTTRAVSPLDILGRSASPSIKLIRDTASPCKSTGISSRKNARKSSVIFAAMRTEGTTIIRAKKSRNHTELLCKHLKLPIIIKNSKNFDEIKIKKVKKINTLNYDIPSDISSSAFFIVLTALSKNSELIIKNVNINPSRIGIITILKKMGVRIIFKNQKTYKGEKKADIKVVSAKNIKAINCPPRLNSGAIDEFLVIFLVAAKAKGISYFSNLNELNQKESPRLEWAKKILNKIGVKTISTKDSIKIFGNPDLNLDLNKKIIIKNYLKDHRVFMTSVIAALTFGGNWKIHDKDSIKTSFPNFLKIINKLKNND